MKNFVRAVVYVALWFAVYFFVTGMALSARGEEPSFVADPACYACIATTAIFVGENAWPHWTAQVRERGVWRTTYIDNGLSVAIMVDRRWTLVSMFAKVDGSDRVARQWFRRPHATGGMEHKPYNKELDGQ